jgi:ABC-type multidrug transport system fused ATPase/permease subunit
MVLLGGVQTLAGPVVGAVSFTWLHDTVARNTEYWRAMLGGIVLVLVLLFPQGIAGQASAGWRLAGALAMSLLEVRGLGKSFGGVRAVDGIGFDIAPGELLALIGPNGAGKSTTFNMVGGQLRADSGSIRLEGPSWWA